MDYTMKSILTMLLGCYLCTGCTLSIILTSTHGVADDVVDSQPTTKTDADLKTAIP